MNAEQSVTTRHHTPLVPRSGVVAVRPAVRHTPCLPDGAFSSASQRHLRGQRATLALAGIGNASIISQTGNGRTAKVI